ncbi:MAG: autotransporter-associated beta strand repeat-containing protein [Verrucomicrobiota bacterium]
MISAASLLSLHLSLSAQTTFTWNVDASGNWNSAANWSPNTGFPGQTDTNDVATFGSAISAPRTITTGQPVFAGTLNIDGNNTYTISNGGVTANTITIASAINNTSGTASHLISAGLVLGNNISIATSSSTTTTLTISGTITDGASSFSITKSGAQTLSLTAANTFDGGFTLSAGTVRVGNASALGTGTLTVNNASAAGIGSSSATSFTLNNAVSLNTTTPFAIGASSGGAIDLAGAVTLNASKTLLSGGTGTISGVIDDGASTFGLAVIGNGTLTLSGNNLFGGGLNLNNANTTLVLGHDNAAGTGSLTLTAGTLTATASRTVGNSLSLAGNVTIGGSQDITFNGTATLSGSRQWTVSNSGTTSLAGVLTDGASSFSFTKLGTGTLVLGNANTFDGGLSLSTGTLAIGNNSALGTGTFTINGGTVSANGASRSIGNAVSVGASFTINGALDLTLSGPITLSVSPTVTVSNAGTTTFAAIGESGGARSLTKSGSGLLVLNAASTFSGGISIDAGTVESAAQDAIGTGGITLNGGTLSFSTADQSYGQAFSISAGSTIDIASNRTLTVGNADNDLTGSGSLTKTGTGTLVLGFANNHSGGLTLNAGTINSTAQGALGTGAVTLSGGSLLIASIDQSFDQSFSINSASTIDVGANRTMTIGNEANDLTGTGGLTKTGSGTLVLSFANNHSGGVAINAGTLASGAQDAVGTGSITLAGGTLAIANVDQTYNQIVNVTSASTVDIANGLTLNLGNAANDFTGTGSLAKIGSGTLHLAANSDHSGGITLSAGTLLLGTDTAAGTGTLNVIGGTIQAGGGSRTLGNDVTLGGDFTSSGANDLTFTGTSTLTGNRTLTVNNTLTLGVIGQDQAGRTLTKAGSGALVVTGTSTYTGGTTLNSGTLRISGDLSSSSNLDINGGLLMGSGTVGSVSVNSGGSISPGNSPGSMTTGDQTWAGGGTYVWQINDADAGQGSDPGWDLLNINGTLNITAGIGNEFTIQVTSLTLGNASGNVHDFNNAQAYTWPIATATSISGSLSGITLDTSSFSNPLGGGTFGLTQAGTTLNVTFTPVPEPEEYALAFGIGLIGFAIWRRRQATPKAAA